MTVLLDIVMYFRNHPNIIKLDLLHSRDYTQLSVLQLFSKMKDKKKEDVAIQDNML